MLTLKKNLLPPVISFIAINAIIYGESSVTSLLVAGIVPGTSLVLPSWVMILIYCLSITVIVTTFVEHLYASARKRQLAQKPGRYLPRRRYSEIHS